MPLWSGITHLSNAISNGRESTDRSEVSSEMTNKVLHIIFHTIYGGLVRYPQVPGCYGQDPEEIITAGYTREPPRQSYARSHRAELFRATSRTFEATPGRGSNTELCVYAPRWAS
jgi:hypothetical protein